MLKLSASVGVLFPPCFVFTGLQLHSELVFVMPIVTFSFLRSLKLQAQTWSSLRFSSS